MNHSIFNDVLGPVMSGTSSSHSAGCASGVIPGAVVSVGKQMGLSKEQIMKGLLASGRKRGAGVYGGRTGISEYARACM